MSFNVIVETRFSDIYFNSDIRGCSPVRSRVEFGRGLPPLKVLEKFVGTAVVGDDPQKDRFLFGVRP